MKFVSVLCVTLLITEAVHAQCQTGWNLIGNKCMICGLSKVTADAARLECNAMGGNLASIVTAAEELFAEGCALPLIAPGGVWIGLRGRGTAPIFTWLDGTPYVDPTGFTPAVTPAVKPTALANNCFYISAANAWLQEATSGPTCFAGSVKNFVCSREATTCEALAPSSGSNVTYSPSTLPHNSSTVATYSCDSGYALSGDFVTRTCQDDGTWSGDEPECTPVDCGPLVAPTNGQIEADTTTYNSVATYSCNTGYTLGSTTPTRLCQADGNWTASSLSCSAVDCGTPATPENGAVSAPATTYGSVATYSCSSNYDLEGSATRTCMATGGWSGAEPTCDNTLAIALGAAFGGLALIGIIGGLIYFLSRASPAGPALPRGPYPRPAPYRRTPGYPRPGPPRGPIRPPVRPVPGRLY